MLLGALVGAGLVAGGCRSAGDRDIGQTAQTAAQDAGVGRVSPGDPSAFGGSGPASPELRDQSGKPGSNPTLREESEMGGNPSSSQHSETRRTDPAGDSRPAPGGTGETGSGAAPAAPDRPSK